jgi:hypothetical protein
MSEITAEQILQIKAIVDRYENFKCVECASNIKDYLTSQGIPGKRIKLYTGYGRGRNSGIYDDSVPGEAISVNGRHEGIAIVINNIEIIFDNHHPDGLNREHLMDFKSGYKKDLKLRQLTNGTVSFSSFLLMKKMLSINYSNCWKNFSIKLRLLRTSTI